MTTPKRAKKAHSESGWAVIVTWERNGRDNIAWETVYRFPMMIYLKKPEAFKAKAEFCEGNNAVESARVVRVLITEQRPARRRKK